MNRAFVVFFLLPFTLLFSEESEPTVTEKQIAINGNKIEYLATTGFIDHQDEIEGTKAQIFYTAYTKKNELPERPITFCFNGGPGSSSVWLHMGAFGPKRLVTPYEGGSVTAPYEWVTNNETILDMTDLVFVDPVSTGYSSAEGESVAPYFDADYDIEYLSEFIQSYLTQKGRWLSPKYLAGESYGTTRCAGISDNLHQRGIYLNGIIFISVAIDFSTVFSSGVNKLPYALMLPTYALTARHYNKTPDSPSLDTVAKEATRFACEEYYPALLQGSYLPKEKRADIAKKLSKLISIDENLILDADLQVSPQEFRENLLKNERKVIGRFDSRINQTKHSTHAFVDPSMSLIEGSFMAGSNAYFQSELRVKKAEYYDIFNSSSYQKWTWPSSPAHFHFFDSLKNSMTTNPELKIFVASGYFDIATAFLGATHLFGQLDEFFQRQVELHNYEGGHMFYLERSAHQKFKQDLKAFYQD